MINRRNIYEWTNRVVQQFNPEKIILFGSYAYGKPGKDSDIDLLVVMPHDGPAVYKASEIRLALPADFSIDVIVRSSETIRKRLQMNDFFIRDILQKGRVLYAAGNA